MEITSRREVFRTPFFSIQAKWTSGSDPLPYYSLEHLDYVTVLPVTSDGRIVLVRQFRPVVEDYCLELPSGHVEAGEEPGVAARRELMEETGYDAQAFELMLAAKPDVGRHGNRIWYFFARDARESSGPWTPEAGIDRVVLSIGEFRETLMRGAFDHALHLAALSLGLAQGKVGKDWLVDPTR
ncbi:MAG: NUDIX hydrolase [Planctomycetota bacterium]|nr:NUDIX hydrolase [Planctomycetota bacterium]